MCKRGSHATGAEIALHDDYGLSNLQHTYHEYPKAPYEYDISKIWSYLASIVNVKLFCEDTDKVIENSDSGDSSVLEGDLHPFSVTSTEWDRLLYEVQNRRT